MKYIEYHFTIEPIEPWRDILLAYLGELPFESFEETEKGLLAYIQQEEDKESEVLSLELLQNPEASISYERNEVAPINWNEEWEKNFSPINVEDKIYLHAEFHPERKDIPHQIIIQPKMSFGTGHHETTYNMLRAMLELDFTDKYVLDMGCGTAVLGIFAKLQGADYVEAIDIDEWAYENAIENAEKNKVEINVKQGNALSISDDVNFNIILANINKNILIQDMSNYVRSLKSGGQLLLSGIYEHDLDDILKVCTGNNLTFVKKWEKNQWISALFNYDKK